VAALGSASVLEQLAAIESRYAANSRSSPRRSPGGS